MMTRCMRGQVKKMDAEAARLDEEAWKKAEADARFKPRGTVTWTLKIDSLDESGMGMRVGVVHRSLKPGQVRYTASFSPSALWIFHSRALTPSSSDASYMW